MNERDEAVAGLREFQQEAALLRGALRGYELAIKKVIRRLEGDEALHEVMARIGVAALRADLVERLTQFESARHRMRQACFRASLAEGLSIGEISRLWGISRQLASRLLRDEGQSSASPAGQLPPRLQS